ncbi:unnamed protein product [Notodromas monacha]|uniref:ER membrane protein complex subunit 10 n=1 Tax=Notodromas monacha TaxID=399045 RepID=A0A7R9BL34_9CRUS|nr:unnamed protein product [Notodromas monacha]CAG0917472.1 unnamed protein product [Notodromas monacha]
MRGLEIIKMLPAISAALCFVCVQAQIDVEITSDDTPSLGRLVFDIEHSFGGEEYSVRGQVVVQSLKSKTGWISQSVPLTLEERNRLKKLAENKGVYKVRVPTPGKNSDYVSTIAPACGLLETGLKDILILTLDSSGNLLGISDIVPVGSCGAAFDWLEPKDFEFNTTLEIRTIEPGPIPETASYIQKIEQEKLAKERGEGKDNRSFFSKYWMYIVIGLVFLMMTGANNPEQGGSAGS